MEELKNCPFCGKPFIFQEITDPGIEVIHENKECHLERFIGWFKSKEQAIEVLNARPIEDALQAKIDDYKESAKRAMESPCDDEKHCACVPYLKTRIDELETKLKQWKGVLG